MKSKKKLVDIIIREYGGIDKFLQILVEEMKELEKDDIKLGYVNKLRIDLESAMINYRLRYH